VLSLDSLLLSHIKVELWVVNGEVFVVNLLLCHQSDDLCVRREDVGSVWALLAYPRCFFVIYFGRVQGLFIGVTKFDSFDILRVDVMIVFGVSCSGALNSPPRWDIVFELSNVGVVLAATIFHLGICTPAFLLALHEWTNIHVSVRVGKFLLLRSRIEDTLREFSLIVERAFFFVENSLAVHQAFSDFSNVHLSVVSDYVNRACE